MHTAVGASPVLWRTLPRSSPPRPWLSTNRQGTASFLPPPLLQHARPTIPESLPQAVVNTRNRQKNDMCANNRVRVLRQLQHAQAFREWVQSRVNVEEVQSQLHTCRLHAVLALSHQGTYRSARPASLTYPMIRRWNTKLSRKGLSLNHGSEPINTYLRHSSECVACYTSLHTGNALLSVL